MAPETHIVRFKIVSIKCGSMPEGQQYTVYYRRGDTSRSTPCYIAHGGMVDFSSMPEGAAVIHFKSGHAGRRYAPKYIQFRIEEYTRGAPRRTVGETEVDCSLTCTNNSNQGANILQINFRMYGVEATMRVAILVYPERMPPLSFDKLITPSDHPAPKAEEPPMEVKFMGRGEAMTLLISLETMLERKREEEAAGKAQPVSRAEKRLKELEERRKSLTATEGMATRVVTARCHECVEAQFVALARKYRKNFIGATAAYFRELAMENAGAMGGVGGDGEIGDEDTMREQLARAARRLDELGQEVKRLEEQQQVLGRLQHKMDVTQELCANLDKVAVLEEQMKLLQQQKDALTTALRSRSEAANTPVHREVREVNAHVKALEGEQEQLRTKVKHMTAVAAEHVLSWARAKNPPEPERPKTDVDDLFRDEKRKEKSKVEKDLSDIQRKQILSAFEGLKPSAPPATARSISASSSSGHRTPRDIFSGAEGLPSMGDFTDKPKKPAAKAQHSDPLKPAGLGTGMFASEAPKAAQRDMPSRNEFNFGGGSSNKREAPPQDPVFDFGAILRQAESGQDSGGGSAFTLEPAGVSMFQAAPPTKPAVTFEDPQPNTVGSSNPFSSASASAPAATAAATATPAAADKKKNDNPYYDDIDDYTVPDDIAAANTGGFTVEFNDDFNFGGAGNSPAPAQAQSPKPSGGAQGGVAPRPTFNFGPSDDPYGNGQPTTAGFTLEGAPRLNFGGDDDGSGTTSATARTNATTGFTNLPTYNFGS